MQAKALTPNPGYTPVAKEVLQFPLAADKLISLIPVASGQDYWFERNNAKIINATGQAGEEGQVQRITRTASKRTYTVDDRAFETVVPKRVGIAADQQGGNEVQEAVVDMSMLTRTRHEKRASLFLADDTKYRTTGSAPLLLTGTTDFVKWTSAALGTPIDDVYRLITNMGPFDPALSKITIAFGIQAANRVATHNTVLEAIKYSKTGGRASQEDLKVLFSKWYPVEEVIFLQSIIQDADGTSASIWAEDEVYISITQKGTPDKIKPTATACFRQKIDGNDDVVVYTDEVREGAHGGTAVRVAVSETFELIDNQYHGRLKDAL